MNPTVPSAVKPGMRPMEVVAAWMKILGGAAPILSVEITRECPLRCPGCYSYNDAHLGGGTNLRDLSDFRSDALVNGVLELVRKHRPLQVSLVGGEPLMRKPELEILLPKLSEMGIFTLLVTSAVAPIPAHWSTIPRLKVTVSVDGLPEHHDVRRKPATYERILKNIKDMEINIHLTITRPMVQSAGYLDEYFAFWSARPEVQRIWVSTFTPQRGEENPECLTRSEKLALVTDMQNWRQKFPKVLMNAQIADSFAQPPKNPSECIFAKMSVNYSADLKTRVEPCIFGGDPDCERCGCASSVGLDALQRVALLGPLKVGHLVKSSISVGSATAKLGHSVPDRWKRFIDGRKLVQIEPPVRKAS